MSDIEKLTELVHQHSEEDGIFSPSAFYDPYLDCIRIVARDCSALEERIGDRITVLVDPYHPRPGAPQGQQEYVGFTIKGARHFCKQHNIPTGTISVTEILDRFLQTCPDEAVQFIVQHIAKPLVEKGKIMEIELPELALENA
jgi:hypothetical protein